MCLCINFSHCYLLTYLLNKMLSNDVLDDNYAMRNAALIKDGCQPPRVTKTGTTIVGVVYKGGVVIGADSRATAGNIIADKHCIKFHRLHDRIYASGAGTAADLDKVTKMIEANMNLLELRTMDAPYVINAVTDIKHHLFGHMGHIGAYLIIGGIDFEGAHLFNVGASGAALQHSYTADGSGSLAATSILEREFKRDMTEEEAVDLLSKALMAGMEGDLNSGNSYSYVVISKERVHIKKDIVPEFCKAPSLSIQYDTAPNVSTHLVTKTVQFFEDETEKMEL